MDESRTRSEACSASWPLATGVTSSWRSSPTKTERLAIARILGAKGLAGGVRVELVTDWPERLDAGSAIYLEDEPEPRRIVDVEWGGRVPVVRLEGVDDREAAEALAGRYLERDADPLPAGTYYWHQLLGLRVTDELGNEIGRVAEVFRAGGNEVYRIEGPQGELLIPALERVVARIDVDGGVMVIRPDAALPEEA
jgi:16S rRNA processing protein RimM